MPFTRTQHSALRVPEGNAITDLNFRGYAGKGLLSTTFDWIANKVFGTQPFVTKLRDPTNSYAELLKGDLKNVQMGKKIAKQKYEMRRQAFLKAEAGGV
jgi:hypothetical protein